MIVSKSIEKRMSKELASKSQFILENNIVDRLKHKVSPNPMEQPAFFIKWDLKNKYQTGKTIKAITA